MNRRLLFILPLLTLALMAGFFAWSLLAGRDPASIGSALVGRPAPDKSLIVEGKPALVNFFASWCAPCLVEHPLFLRLKEREGATIVGVAWKNKREEAEAWLARLGNPYARIEFDLDGRTLSSARPARGSGNQQRTWPLRSLSIFRRPEEQRLLRTRG